MSEETSFDAMMGRLRDGNEDAATEIFRRFAHRLTGLARVRLDAQLQRKVDPEDVLQSVYRSFFARFDRGEFDLGNWDALWALLTLLTVRKCARWAQHFHTGGRDVGREAAPAPPRDQSGGSWEALSREPRPDEAAMLAETVEGLMRLLSARDQEILSLSLQGTAIPAISTQVGCTERTVYRVLEFVRQRLERQCRECDGPDVK